MHRIAVASFALGLLVGLVACATPVIDYQAGADFTSYHTVQIAKPDEEAKSLDLNRVDNAVYRELPARGLKVVSHDADLELVARFVEVNEYESTGMSWGIGGISGPVGVGVSSPTRAREIKTYKLEIELVDRKARQVVWKAQSASSLSQQTTGARRDAWMDDNVKSMLERFPPGK